MFLKPIYFVLVSLLVAERDIPLGTKSVKNVFRISMKLPCQVICGIRTDFIREKKCVSDAYFLLSFIFLFFLVLPISLSRFFRR